MFAEGVELFEQTLSKTLISESNIPIDDFYYSVTNNQFGWGECPLTDDSIRFGSYPQSKVTDSNTIYELNLLDLDWKSYGYYSGNGEYGSMTSSDYMKYADVEYKGNKYRAVEFTSYRPNSTFYSASSDYSNQDGYNLHTIYWFRFEPLKWRILDLASGYIMCENIIDAQAYSNTVYYSDTFVTVGYSINYEYWNDAAYTNYTNDYETSSIRSWLNDDFYNTAFSESEKNKIKKTTLDNQCASAGSGYDIYDSDQTEDKIFLLSYFDTINPNYGFDSKSYANNIARCAQGSDYAKCQGLSTSEIYSDWLLRSPGFGGSNCTSSVNKQGHSRDSSNYPWVLFGIRPAIKISNLQLLMSTALSEYSSITYIPAEEIKIETYSTNTDAQIQEVTCNSCIANDEYLLLSLSDYDNNVNFTSDNLMFIDMFTADKNGKLTATFIHKSIANNATTLLIGDFGNGIEVCEIRAIDHTCEYNIFSHYQVEHPHYAVYKCSCGTQKLGAETIKVDSCTVCNPTHVCNFATLLYYQAEHPHYVVYKCDCGAVNVGTKTTHVDDCQMCELPHIHGYTIFADYQTAHPHYAVYKCSCGAEQVTTETTTVDGCTECYTNVEKTVVSLTVTAQPSVNRYKYGVDNLDTSGLEITAKYSDNTTAVIDNSEIDFTGFDTSKRGVKTITANYEGCTATFDIEVYFTFWQWLLYIICFGWIWM